MDQLNKKRRAHSTSENLVRKAAAGNNANAMVQSFHLQANMSIQLFPRLRGETCQRKSTAGQAPPLGQIKGRATNVHDVAQGKLCAMQLAVSTWLPLHSPQDHETMASFITYARDAAPTCDAEESIDHIIILEFAQREKSCRLHTH